VQFDRQPGDTGTWNDYRDAEATAEAVQRPTMHFVAIKTPEQMDLLALHRVRSRLVSQRTGVTNGAGFTQGRDFGAWLGLRTEAGVDRGSHDPGQDRNKYLRTLFVQAAHVVLARRPSAAMRGLWPWIEQASRRLHRNMLTIALANKLARIARAVLARGRSYQPRIVAI
jgi:transposase